MLTQMGHFSKLLHDIFPDQGVFFFQLSAYWKAAKAIEFEV